ncbi:hypothetical protein ET475_00485 [Microbacterium protaetiae]|uniref:Uncharacterized protein n=1 Tax=Microbacterium protaetiae TaxID=2509458 RepID=A0A4P6ELD4_9MICO|nr:hypothetical protein [Microbacterium protaetiae]QAY58628.1 hypothetical protein ET475_00485 [Microbacterium protaetiae]
MDVDDSAVEGAYLDEVERAVSVRDPDAASHIRAEIAAHIVECRSDAEQRGEPITIHDIIAEIGDPLAVAAEVPTTSGKNSKPSRITLFARWEPISYVWAVCLLIAVGSSLYFIGWALGLIMMWTSALWSRRVKIWSTAVIPGCLLLALIWFDFVFVAGYLGTTAIAVLLYFTSAPVKARRAAKRAATAQERLTPARS